MQEEIHLRAFPYKHAPVYIQSLIARPLPLCGGHEWKLWYRVVRVHPEPKTQFLGNLLLAGRR